MARKKGGARVFVSYTKADAALARLIALEIGKISGASAFSYLGGTGKRPRALDGASRRKWRRARSCS